MEPFEVLFYAVPEGKAYIEVFFEEETFWLSQKKMADLFGVEFQTINYHLKEIFKTNELEEDSVIRKIRITADDGKNYLTNFYNLDAIIAVGYRVNSLEATRFRIWSTKTLREYIIKGFVLDDERLKQGKRFGKDYFDELLERIRDQRCRRHLGRRPIIRLFAGKGHILEGTLRQTIGRVKEGFIKRLPTYTRSAVLTTTQRRISPESFIKRFKINCIGPLPGIPLLN